MGRPNKPWTGPTHDHMLKRIAPAVIKYTQWYCEHGHYLPQQYESDPATWTQILRYIEAVFIAIHEGKEPSSPEEIGLKEQGLNYFYIHFKDLWR